MCQAHVSFAYEVNDNNSQNLLFMRLAFISLSFFSYLTNTYTLTQYKHSLFRVCQSLSLDCKLLISLQFLLLTSAFLRQLMQRFSIKVFQFKADEFFRPCS